MIIVINNTIYDISTFIDEHPGGNNVFPLRTRSLEGGRPKDSKDMTEQFNEVGHSSYAVSLLSNYKLKEIYPDDPRFNANHTKLQYNQKNKQIIHTRR